jgi:hypothetical protein
MTTITIGSSTYSLCAMPAHPGAAAIEIAMNDAVAVVTSPFTRQEQAQSWPGGDFWDATITLPPMTPLVAAGWRGFLAELRGRANVLQLSDPSAMKPGPAPVGAPVANSTGTNNLPMTTSLVTRGWPASTPRLMLRGQEFQIGYRLHMVCGDVASDSGGNATLSVYPSLRETPADGAALNLVRPAGLFRLAANRRSVQWSPGRMVSLSFKCVEAAR